VCVCVGEKRLMAMVKKCLDAQTAGVPTVLV
jgi:hypothetical protein